MARKNIVEDNEVSGDEKAVESILAPFSRPRKIVDNWGMYRSMGLGVENFKDPWYYHRPVFSHLWNNAYLGVGEDSARTIERFFIPKQHLYYLSLLLHDALLQEKYVQAAYIMIAISQNPQSLPEQIWRCGMEVLKKCPSNLMGTKRKFYKLMSALCPQYSNQMVIDMAFQILNNGNDAREAFQFLVSNINNKRVKYDVMFRAYIGMFEYVLWKIDLAKGKDYEKHEDCGSNNYEKVSVEHMNYSAKRALESMRVVLYESGIWDCMILKMLEILDYYSNIEEAASMLEMYRDKNMDNPNAHRYLYLYLKKNNLKKDKHFGVLRDLIKLDITNDLAHEYFDLLKIQGENCKVIELLFQRLDHCCCKNNRDDWRMLYGLVKSCKRHPSSAAWSKIQDCVSERRSWWPKYHFASCSIVSLREAEPNVSKLLKYKRKISSYLKFKGSCQKELGNYSSDTSSNTSNISFNIGSKRRKSRTVDESNFVAKKRR